MFRFQSRVCLGSSRGAWKLSERSSWFAERRDWRCISSLRWSCVSRRRDCVSVCCVSVRFVTVSTMACGSQEGVFSVMARVERDDNAVRPVGGRDVVKCAVNGEFVCLSYQFDIFA